MPMGDAGVPLQLPERGTGVAGSEQSSFDVVKIGLHPVWEPWDGGELPVWAWADGQGARGQRPAAYAPLPFPLGPFLSVVKPWILPQTTVILENHRAEP
jgi:hypothetical protein